LGVYITGKDKRVSPLPYRKNQNLDFVSPGFRGKRVDSQVIRQKILNISYSVGKRWGFPRVLCIT
jgi:hypothetical protein